MQAHRQTAVVRSARAGVLAAAAVLTASLPAVPAAAATARVHAVQQILRDGKPVSSAAGVTVTPDGGTAQTTIRIA
jgi:hypothetical protein